MSTTDPELKETLVTLVDAVQDIRGAMEEIESSRDALDSFSEAMESAKEKVQKVIDDVKEIKQELVSIKNDRKDGCATCKNTQALSKFPVSELKSELDKMKNDMKSLGDTQIVHSVYFKVAIAVSSLALAGIIGGLIKVAFKF